MSNIMWGRFAIWTTVIMAGGYGIMKWSMPTEDQLYDALSPELKRKVDAVRAQREQNTTLRDTLASADAEDKIVWGDQLQSPKPNQGGRRV